jgi:hypothetical protein
MCESRGVPLPLLHGPRLELKPASLWNRDFFADLNSDADVMEHISGQPASRSESEEVPGRPLIRASGTGSATSTPSRLAGGALVSRRRSAALVSSESVSSGSTGVEGSARRMPAR